MRKNNEITDLLFIIEKGKKPMNADQIAKAANTIRNRVAPFLKLMVSNGQLLEILGDEQSAPKFTVSHQVENYAPAPVAIEARETASDTTAESLAHVLKGNADPVTASNVHQLHATENTTLSPVEPAASSSDDKRMEILRLLTAQPMVKLQIIHKLGDVEDLLKTMKAEGLLMESYIISDYTWEPTEAAYAKYPELLSQVLPTETEIAPVDTTAATVPDLTIDEVDVAEQPPQEPVIAEVKLEAPAPAAYEQELAVITPVTPAQDVEASVLSELSMHVTKVVEKLLQDRLGSMTEELRLKDKQIADNQQIISEISAGITECTDAFQSSINALNKLAAKISKLS